MKIISIAVFVLIFSGVIAMTNSLGIFDNNLYDPEYTYNQSQAESITQISGSVDSKEGWYDKLEGGVEFGMKMASIAATTLAMGLNLGGLIHVYVPNVVGEQIGLLITTISYFFYAWGLFQIWRKFSSKGAD